ncbi:MAG: glycosyltransferase family 2 protein, partial [Bryobacteraceae bacterium]|nr:glycosyltransferase family 2 protein [Bryobacteraceae bacterium]
MSASREHVKVAFASCFADLVDPFVRSFAEIAPELELFVVSEFPPVLGRWIPWRFDRSTNDNLARISQALKGRAVRHGAIVLQPGAPYRDLQWTGLRIAGLNTLLYNQNLDHFSLRLSGVPGLSRHLMWRLREHTRFQLRPGGDLYTWLWRLRHPEQLRRPWSLLLGQWAGRRAALRKRRLLSAATSETSPPKVALPAGITVVIPSRNGKTLLERLLPEIRGKADEIIVVDNGSDDETEAFLRGTYPDVRIVHSAEPLSFARAVNRGVHAGRFSHVCLLNNDMVPDSRFLAALREAFDQVPDLFCATAQIFFPAGKRREETGKAVMRPIARIRTDTHFPVHCIEPIADENLTWVLYGSGGCSLYDMTKLLSLGGIGEVYEPAYVEDLDIGVRAWQRGWPTVFVANANTVHDHRTTTSRYYTESELALVLERNYLRFLARSIVDPDQFALLWSDALIRLNRKAALENDEAAATALADAGNIAGCIERQPRPVFGDEEILALGSGDVAVFPGRAQRQNPVVLIASCYSPYPLSDGGAVRMYNLMRYSARDFSQVLITFVDDLHTPAGELLDICVEVIQVRRLGSHSRAG